MRRLRLPLVRQRLLATVAAVAAVGLLATAAVVVAPRTPPPVGRYGLPLDLDPRSPSLVGTVGLPEEQQRSLVRITSRPQAVWLTEVADVQERVRERVDGAAGRGAVATLVLYRIPRRDCGSFSAPEDDLDPAGYRAWIRAIVRGLGERRAIVILEPDALPSLDCLKGRARATRSALLRDAVDRLAAQGSWVYVDAGHSGWRSAATMARRLQRVHVRRAAGFSLNVSAYGSTEAETAYGRAIRSRIGGRTAFVIDTGRNGASVQRGRWCNARAARLGRAPTSSPGIRAVDALLWIKTPGASDGACRGGPAAGVFWPTAAKRLLRR